MKLKSHKAGKGGPMQNGLGLSCRVHAGKKIGGNAFLSYLPELGGKCLSWHGNDGSSGVQELLNKIREGSRSDALSIAKEIRNSRPVFSMENPIDSSGSIDETKLMNMIKGSTPVQISRFVDDLDVNQTRQVIDMLPEEETAKMVCAVIDSGKIDLLQGKARKDQLEKLFGRLDRTYIERAMEIILQSDISNRIIPNVSDSLKLVILRAVYDDKVEHVVEGIRRTEKRELD